MSLRSAEAAVIAMEGIEGVISLIDNDSGDGSFEEMSREAADRGWTAERWEHFVVDTLTHALLQ